MHSKRIVRIQKRAKRRLIALAIVAAVIVGYSSRSLFAVQEQAKESQIAKIISKPGVKAVGIRLINPNGDAQVAGNSSAPYMQSVPSLPSPALPTMTAPYVAPKPSQLPPAPAYTNAPSLPVSGFSLLPAPPRMTDAVTKNTTGKVVMKLSGDSHNSSVANTPKQTPAIGVAESEVIEIIPPRSLGQPAKMPQFLFEKSSQKVTNSAFAASNSTTSAVRISIADSSSEPASSSSIDSTESSPAVPKNRTPQLVKSKPTQLGHTVVLAQSTDLEISSSVDQPDDAVPPVEVNASLVPNAITNGAAVSKHHVGTNAKVATFAKAVVSDAVEDAFISFVPPAIEQGVNGQQAGNPKTNSQVPGLPSDTMDVSATVDSFRRKFDSSLADQPPTATVELECLTAASMDIAGKLTALAVQDDGVCKVLHNGRTVSIVGNQQGSTLVQVWTSELGDRPQVLRVNVSQQKGKVQATRNEVKDIKQVITQSFPGSDVNIISKDDGSIEVRGNTESEESAKRILELVRKIYLVPVKDKLTAGR